MKSFVFNRTSAVILLFLATFISLNTRGQSEPTVGEWSEKIYTHTDRPFYFPGETIWFKSYIVNADNTASGIGEIMYTQLIAPDGSTVKTFRSAITQGYSYGQINIGKDWIGGIYKLRSFTNWMRNQGEESFFTKEITIQKAVKPNLLLHLDFEKESYGPLSNVSGSFEAKDLKNNPITDTPISYTVAVQGVEVIKEKVSTDENGKAEITFCLPANLQSRDVVLNIVIAHKGSNESISRSIPVVLDNIDLQFLPEGGKIVADAINRIAFKAVDEFGKPADVEGEIFDKEGNQITTFKSFHDGMGAFKMDPDHDQKYYALITAPFRSEKKILLPEVHKEGVSLRVETDSLLTRVRVHSTLNRLLFLEIANANGVLERESIAKGQDLLEIDTSDLPVGITRFRISDDFGTPLSERLVFLNAHRQLKVTLELDKKIYQTREKVHVTVTSKDIHDEPVPANLSVAVVDNKLLSFADDKQDHILSSLLLTSELQGKIHEPDFYFNPEEELSYEALDYVMLTHGWRNYILNPVSLSKALFKPERLAVQSGKIVDQKGNPVIADLLLFDQSGRKVLVFKTDDRGRYSFKYDKSNLLILIAYTADGRKLRITEEEKVKGYTSSRATGPKAKTKDPDNPLLKYNKGTEETIKKKATASLSLNSDSQNLDEIVVVGYSAESRSKLTGASVTMINSSELELESSLGNALQGRVAGVQIVNEAGTPGNTTAVRVRGINSLSGNNQPLIIVDGTPYPLETLEDISAHQVDQVTVLKNAAAQALYGSAATNGVIVVTTKNNSYWRNNWRKKKLNNAKYNNYAIKTFYNRSVTDFDMARQFYMPKYEGEKLPEERNDFRQTIYWNPVVQTDENGIADFEFYNSDAITSFEIITEGVGYNGLAGRVKRSYATKKLLNTDFKLPNYMALNDTISLPVTINNESDESITVNLELEFPEEIKIVDAPENELIIPARGSAVRNVVIIPQRKLETGSLTIRAKAGEMTDIVEKETVIISPYFPTEIAASGMRSANYEFSVDQMVEGSLKADLTLYLDVIGDVMDGVEGMIRAPWGCFEQVSSSTYPNILVLKYLRTSGKSNPEIEKKALGFIKKGYTKLAGYETRKNGFEWYGNTPPHEALSAYGLMEFTEMKEVYDGVSQPMIKRTIEFLLSRRDGKGGFKQNRGKYGFSAAPENVNNAYIVYAISESGVDVDIDSEYQYNYEQALKDKDAYRMALMTCASYNLNKEENAIILTEKLKETITTFGFADLPVEHTITRSYWNSKNVETAAFTLLALMKQEVPDMASITSGIEYLMTQRKNGRFGSTQATSMVLKVLIEYQKYQNELFNGSNQTVELTINGETLSKALKITEDGKIHISGLEQFITEGQQEFGLKLSDKETTIPYTLNVSYDSYLPDSSEACPLKMETVITGKTYQVGDNVRMNIAITNESKDPLGMVTAIIGIPSGTTAQPWQLKELLEEEQVAYYEIFDNYLVFYWRSMQTEENKTINLDLKADIPGQYQAPASTIYLYYGDEHKSWIPGNSVEIK
ncbi:TonB-dependent receptor plug domain-containing protein [Robertkochia sediminum]|uniref:TonB-dependent receptor plug domain-containing protein n=1 Tax=Robertkochia sediminum TaxID=2785326 RepID=UPI0019312E4F|nr:TonB-dependent receptor plug domain-containing protein [Robertkochia sediminum]MBL7471569.1 TonB-dependent receptor plug domain-containing protein [Robertkochia sediminum]